MPASPAGRSGFPLILGFPNLWAALLGNDTDADAGDTRAIVSVDTTSLKGTVTFNAATKTLACSADADEFDLVRPGATVQESFSYTMADSAGATSTARVTVTVAGGANNAPVTVTIWSDAIAGNAGEDIIRGGLGNNTISGLDGADQLWGGLGDERLFGGKGIGTRYGEPGDDILDSGDGNDVLHGGLGNDRLTGGPGADLFVIEGGLLAGIDTITDFEVGVDHLSLEGIRNYLGVRMDVDFDDTQDGALLFAGGAVRLLWVSDVSDPNALMA
ncbi:calcium-binding protein [Roseomonas elaeocarpi]|uniref:Calcium-binding protein n=1 Tax=Roseomonas elaeocarpi TaxID=907779 RepID=A0ABV6JLR9_9PROT